MDGLALGIAGAVLFGGVALREWERGAARDVAARLRGGSVDVRTRTNLSLLGGTICSATITARDFATDGLPLTTEPDRSRAGKLDRLVLRLREFELRGLKVAKLDALIPGCRFDLGFASAHRKVRLSKSGEGTGTVEVRAADLQRFVLRKFPQIERCVLRLQDGLVRMTGKFAFARAEFSLSARLVCPDGRRLMLEGGQVSFDGKPMEGGAARALLAGLSPVLDLDRDLGLLGAVDVTRLELRNDWLKGTAKTRIPVHPEWFLRRWRWH